eukprot:CAMPEP_0184481276 /NCGR_PEP_ID=MMETSP0113_2-20130426/2824_1 /TAXON_ID=91329 /ORGANISM="Norrisiella sphaerica, Strain BC52" /LENGTH=398 /DNA_ID=CAMNT_0026860301 /DNA_START=506 /DNA_END=1702 /DNA_ORIENTATION=-
MGGGSFGTAMAICAASKGHNVTLLVRRQEIADEINEQRIHPRFGDIVLDDKITATTDYEKAFGASADRKPDMLVHAVPAQASRDFLHKVKPFLPKSVPIVSCSKGIEVSSQSLMHQLMADVLRDETTGELPPLAFISGPSFADELARGVATGLVVASKKIKTAKRVAELLASDVLRTYATNDVIGVEVGGALKNVIALAAGIAEGLELGMNARSAIVTRGCYEMRRLGHLLGGRQSTLTGLAGIGDTFGTCFGPMSRNRRTGERIGRGEKIEEILESMDQVAEGVPTAKALVKLIQQTDHSYRIDLKYPIIFGVADILDGIRTPLEGFQDIMRDPLRMEMYELKRDKELLSRERELQKRETHIEELEQALLLKKAELEKLRAMILNKEHSDKSVYITN